MRWWSNPAADPRRASPRSCGTSSTRAEASLVCVLVAARAVAAGHGAEHPVGGTRRSRRRPARRVAPLAGHRGVPAGEGPRRLRVVEPRRGLPRLLAVAGAARAAGELPPVLVLVARRAVGHRAEERALLVALVARERAVLAGERVARLRVVERRAARLAPPHELVLDALVLDVARLAVAVFGPRVESLAGGDPPGEGLVALEALVGGDALVGVVAVEAVAAALELRVGPAQRAGRDLGRRGRGAERRARRDAERSRARGASRSAAQP